MAYKVETLFNAMVRQFHSDPSNDRFVDDFVDAVNASVDELSFRADLTTAIGHIKKVDDSIGELDPKHHYIMMAGVAFGLSSAGWEHSEGNTAFDRLQAEWNRKLGDYQVMKSWEDQATVDDDGVPTADIAGLGYLGDD
jgi:hypothetical protein